jgi:hypothetical protein
VEPSPPATRCDDPSPRDPAALASALREASASAHRALRSGADASTLFHLTARIDGIERGFRDLGLHDLARFAGRLKREIERGG